METTKENPYIPSDYAARLEVIEAQLSAPVSSKRLAWPLVDLAGATGTSVAFWKKIIGKGEIPATKAGARTLILDEDVRAYLMKNRRVRGNGNGSAKT